MNSDSRTLVGDVGGTHARFALIDASGNEVWQLRERLDLTEPFPSFYDALSYYFERAGLTSMPQTAAIAVAGPVEAGTARFTNRGWVISEQGLREFGFSRARVINDFAALAMAVDLLDDTHLHPIGPVLSRPQGGVSTILGAGTGFGVSCVAHDGERAVPLASEGGHIAFAPTNSEELAVLQLMWKHSPRISVERILSGEGLERLYQTLEQLAGRAAHALTAAEISAAAMRQEAGPHAALTMFCAIFGAVAGDLALAHGARSGVYIAGGIAEKIAQFLIGSPFRQRFEDKGRLSSYIAAIPTYLIAYPDLALLGAGRSGLSLADTSPPQGALTQPHPALQSKPLQ